MRHRKQPNRQKSTILHPKLIAEMMWNAYGQIHNPPKKLDWDYVEEHEICL